MRYIFTLLDLDTRWRLVISFTSRLLYSRYPLCRWLVGPRAGLDTMKKRKISCHYRESNSGRPVSSPSLYRLSYPGSIWDYVWCVKTDEVSPESCRTNTFIHNHQTLTNEQDGNTLDLYSRGAGFDSRPGHRLSLDSFRCFTQSLHANFLIVSRLDHDRLLPNPFQSTNHQTIRRCRV
jgi:hypothetical protein